MFDGGKKLDFAAIIVRGGRYGAKTLEHAREALGLDDAKMKKIRAEAATIVERFE